MNNMPIPPNNRENRGDSEILAKYAKKFEEKLTKILNLPLNKVESYFSDLANLADWQTAK